MAKRCNLAVATALVIVGLHFWPMRAVAQSEISGEALKAAQTMVSFMAPSLIDAANTQVTSQVWPAIEASVRKKNPTISAEAINALRAEFQNLQNSFANELLAEAPTLYARHYTVDELRQLTAFYQSPVGAKSLTVTPIITSEFAVVGAQHLSSMESRARAAMNAVLRVYGYIPN